MKQKSLCFIGLFAVGGIGYNLLECLWRGYTHWSMFVLGGICFHLIGRIGERMKGHSLVLSGIACAAAVTVAEFLSGCLLNRCWHLDVWDYSHLPVNLSGQICLLYSVLWGLLSIPVIFLYRGIRAQLLRRIPC